MSKSFGNTISYLRKEKCLSQKQASEDLGISQALLSHYEKGIRECSLDFVVKIADYYNVSCDYLLGRTAERNMEENISNESLNNRSMLENLNSKVIMNSIEFIFRILTEINQREITKNTSEIIMIELYSIIRSLYKINPDNDENFFNTSHNNYDLQCSSMNQLRKFKLAEKINQLSKNKNFQNKVNLSYSIINDEYSDISSSVLNLIHNSEKQLNKV